MLSDLRFAFRQLIKSPGFTVVAVLSLGLGIGACTAVFSVANAILLRSLPVPDPHELRGVVWSGTDVRVPSYPGSARQDASGWRNADSITPPAYRLLREQATGMAEIIGFAPIDNLVARTPNGARDAVGTMVSDNFFSGLGVRPLIGRLLEPDSDYAGPGSSVVLGYDWWQRYYNGDPTVLGQDLVLNGASFTIVGVLPREFAGVEPGQAYGLFLPMALRSPFLYMETLESDFHWFVHVMARLKPGISDAQLETALDVAFAGKIAEVMDDASISLLPGFAGKPYDRGNYLTPLMLMLGIAGVVMLIACANLAGLALARGAGRQHELAIRAALGSGRWRLVRQTLVESLVLAGAGGALGIVLAVWTRAGVLELFGGPANGLTTDLGFDSTVFGFSLLVAVVAAVLSGLLPALQAGRSDPLGGLKARSTLGVPRLRAGRILITAQVGLSLLLLTGAGLFTRSLANLARIDAGFDPDNILLVQCNISGSDSADAQPAAFYARVQESLTRLPGVEEATLLDFPLLGGANSSGSFEAFSGRPAGTTMQTRRLRVGESFFQTMGIPMLLGRGFNAGDSESAPKVVVVNEAFVRQYLPDETPLGLTFRIWGADWEIVGVCRDVKFNNLKAGVPPTTYFPYQQMFYSRYRTSHLRSPYFALRTSLPPLTLVASVREAVAGIDPDVALTDFTTQEAVLHGNVNRERLLALLCGIMAGLALVLACIGLYGLMAYNVARRTSEFGIRMALGATGETLAWPIVREALALGLVGTLVGVPLALGLYRLASTQLYGVTPYDPAAYIGGIVLLISVVLLAAWVPARRAARVDPLTALRAE